MPWRESRARRRQAPVSVGRDDRPGSRIKSAGSTRPGRSFSEPDRRAARAPWAVIRDPCAFTPRTESIELERRGPVRRSWPVSAADEEIDIRGIVAGLPETVPPARASASARSKTVSRVFRSYIARKAQFREVISQGRSGPAATQARAPSGRWIAPRSACNDP